ncbi:MAG: hypothetical protein BGO21_08560 [Dyadobacter sp. 50-39]|uniref:replication protein RepA n=1 Tax=Dyadobacter sp. 50-39 TaxID=1895756 RepID=UPI0009660636|nr:replication protein RepA [Dyadobacter sp. 50-39]OJV19298.1 MAG: hypothetical protein BGO21_08560 [Dyadobacter sp. 50-39]
MTKKEGKAKKNTIITDRLVKTAYDMATEDLSSSDVAYISAPLCHVFLPYSNPGDDVDFWYRSHGNFHLSVQATQVFNPRTGKPERFGLPYGPKPRFMLALLNTVIFNQKSPELKLGDSLTAFVGHHLGLNTGGRTINEVKNQLARLSTSLISGTYELEPGHTYQDSLNLIRGFDVWWTKDTNQRHLWGNYIRFSDDYFNDIMEHGVPVDKRALSALSGNALALDIYAFLAHRLHHIPSSKPLLISWKAIKDQFGPSYARMDKFKAVFRHTLQMVKAVYHDAKIEETENRGFVLKNSPAPVPPKTSIVVPKIPGLEGEERPPLVLSHDSQGFDKLYLKHDPHSMSDRKANQIVREATGQWDGISNARYKNVKKKPPKDK